MWGAVALESKFTQQNRTWYGFDIEKLILDKAFMSMAFLVVHLRVSSILMLTPLKLTFKISCLIAFSNSLMAKQVDHLGYTS